MSQISKRFLKKDIENRIMDIFTTSVSNVQLSTDVYNFIHDLLSATEQIMLSKRLAIAFMLYKGYDQRTISDTLKVSSTTVNRVNAKLQNYGQGYRKVINDIVGKEKREQFWQKIDDLLSEIVPPKGRNWSDWRRSRYLDKLQRQKPF